MLVGGQTATRLLHCPQNDDDLGSNDRIAEFIDRTAKYAVGSEAGREAVGERSSRHAGPEQLRVGGAHYDFHVDQRGRELFIALFRLAKDKLQGQGFSL